MRKRNINYTFTRLISISILLLSCSLFQVQAQQVSLYDQYYINPSIYNPAAVGHNDLFDAYLIRNEKFRDFDSGQVLHAFTLSAGLNDGKYGLGLNLSNNSVGIFNTTQADLAYAFRIKISDRQAIRLGLSAGISDFRLKLNKANADMNDDLLQANQFNNTVFAANIGAYYTNGNLTLGISVPQIINKSNLTQYDQNDLYRQSRHFLFSGSYEIPIISIKNLSFVPNFMLRYIKNTPMQYDANAMLKLKDKGWFSVNYRNKYAIGLNIGVHALNNFKVGYSYNVNTQNSAQISATNHEFLIGYSFQKSSSNMRKEDLNEYNDLKELLEEKYSKIKQLEKELELYATNSQANDQDRDGVLDEDDLCPNTPPFFKVDDTGCSLDTDNDGIFDSEDMCPEKPGSFTNNGCPDLNQKRIPLDKSLENFFFEFGKANLTETSIKKAKRIVVMMTENSTYVLKLHGHTDDIGSPKHNRILSFKRLVTLNEYLIQNGIKERRIIILPFGESAPLMKNTNEKSRAFNRRVYLEMYSYEEE